MTSQASAPSSDLWRHRFSVLTAASVLVLIFIGGLVTSTFLARLVTPVMYKLIPPHISPVSQTGGTLAAPAGAMPAPASRLE